MDRELDMADVIRIGKAYSKMGWAIQEQLESVLDLGIKQALEDGELNMNALSYIYEFLEVCEQLGIEEAMISKELLQNEEKKVKEEYGAEAN